MELPDLDLNLWVVFHHLVQQRNVSRAAAALGLSQPAVSNALRRLRQVLGDELFLRTPRGMEPTPYALQLAEPVALALSTLHTAMNLRSAFEPSTSQRTFTLAMTDVGETYFLPLLMQTLAHQAPHVTVRTLQITDTDLKDAMASGQIDLALGLLPQLQAGFFQQMLFRQRYVCLMRQGHPLTGLAALTVHAYTSAEHVRVVAAGTGHGRIEVELDRLDVARHVRLTVPHFVALGPVLAQTDLVATVPERFALRVAPAYGLVSLELPIGLPQATIHQFWHGRLHRDPGCQWLRGVIANLFVGMDPVTQSVTQPLAPS